MCLFCILTRIIYFEGGEKINPTQWTKNLIVIILFFTGKNRLVGDMLALGGAFLSGICHVGLEHSVQYDTFEFLGLVGLFGTIITAAQM